MHRDGRERATRFDPHGAWEPSIHGHVECVEELVASVSAVPFVREYVPFNTEDLLAALCSSRLSSATSSFARGCNSSGASASKM